jgi:cytochrome P450
MARKPVDPVKLNLRFTEGLRSRLERQANRNNHSLNSEIVRRLEQSFVRDIEREREKTHVEKNSEALEWMLGGNEAATDLMRKIVFELQSHPRWDERKQDRKLIADEIHRYIYNPEIFERGEQ